MVLAEDAVPKGLAMLIRSEKYGVQGGAANAVRPEAIPAASLPTLLIGGLLLLICPCGPSGRFAPGHSGVARDHQTLSALKRRTTYKEFSNDHREQVREGPRRYIRHHFARRRTMPRRHHEFRGEARGRRDARRYGRRCH